MKNIQQELARQREEVRVVQQQLRQQLLPYPMEENWAWGPSFILSNIQRLITLSGRTKSGVLSDQAQLNGALFVAVTETWLTPQVFNS